VREVLRGKLPPAVLDQAQNMCHGMDGSDASRRRGGDEVSNRLLYSVLGPPKKCPIDGNAEEIEMLP